MGGVSSSLGQERLDETAITRRQIKRKKGELRASRWWEGLEVKAEKWGSH